MMLQDVPKNMKIASHKGCKEAKHKAEEAKYKKDKGKQVKTEQNEQKVMVQAQQAKLITANALGASVQDTHLNTAI